MITCRPVLERWLMDGVVLVDPVEQPGLLRLEGTAAALWDIVAAAPGGVDETDLVQALATEYAVTTEAIRVDVDAAVELLVVHGAVHRD
ncbi:MAG: PqqD family protein [Acidimicrobiia bacterium]|nr:PqqD family protein [Acidimicrobiia bacterium]